MTDIQPSSPWWPLFVAFALAHGHAPDNYPPRLEHWMEWHFHFHLRGEGFIPMPPLIPADVPHEVAA